MLECLVKEAPTPLSLGSLVAVLDKLHSIGDFDFK